MKRLISCFVAFMLFITGNTAYALAAQDVLEVSIYDEYEDDIPQVFTVPCVSQDGRFLVPIRDVVEAFGADVFWYGDSQTIAIYRGVPMYDLSKTNEYGGSISPIKTVTYGVLLQIGNQIMYYRDAETQDGEIILDVAPQIIDGRTMLPLRAVCEYLNTKIDWYPEDLSVGIMPIRYERLEPEYPGEYANGNINKHLETENKNSLLSGDSDSIRILREIAERDALNQPNIPQNAEVQLVPIQNSPMPDIDLDGIQ